MNRKVVDWTGVGESKGQDSFYCLLYHLSRVRINPIVGVKSVNSVDKLLIYTVY